ncbi:MAG: hypothetical protein RLZZ524_3161 [Pseudomonadota bacterium]
MATNYTNTLAGLLALNDRRLSEAEGSDVLNAAPFVLVAHAQPASNGGTQHMFNRVLTAPGVGFRGVSEGITNAAGTFEDVTLNCALLDGSFSRDKALALAYRKGAVAYMDKEATMSLREAFFKMECAIFRSNINKQFTGLPGSGFFDATGDGQVINAAGNGGRSVWLLRCAEDGISIVAGNEGRVDMATEDATIQALDSSSRPYTALHRSILGWFGLQIGSKYDAARVANLDGTTGHTLTDGLLAQALAKFPAARQPTHIVMSRTSHSELQQSRTATNPTGAPAPFPTEAFGFPIVVTDAIPEDEAALNTTTTTTTTSTQA